MEAPLDKYIREHSTPQSETLKWIEKQTNIHTNYPRMLSGAVQGRFLTLLVQMLRPQRILEIGTFTGYSAICMAMGLPEGGHIDTLEINDEMESLIREGFRRSGYEDRISLHIGDARDTVAQLRAEILGTDRNTGGELFDLVYMDANKREYCEYYDLLFDVIRPGGYIIADDVLWDGKVYESPMPQDKQTVGIAAFNDRIADDPRVENVILPLRDGVNIIRKK